MTQDYRDGSKYKKIEDWAEKRGLKKKNDQF